MRVAILASGWAGFNDAACRELAARGVEILLVTERTAPDTAYDAPAMAEYAEQLLWDGDAPTDEIVARLGSFAPDVVLMHSWHHQPYRTAIKGVPATTLRVLWMDNVWRNVPKQWVGRAVAPFWVRPLFDAVMVPSDRTEFFARRLGFDESDVIRGSLSADTTLFGSAARDGADLQARGTFLACLRLVHHKGADVLAQAYRRYRDLADDPWDLDVAGLGPMAAELEAIPGVRMLGFQQPAELAQVMRASSCLVVPSRIDPYGVVVHEGAVSALPILATAQTGAGPAFVQDGRNGWLVDSGDAEALATAMARTSALPADRLTEMSQVSLALGSRLSSVSWARHLHEQLDWRLGALRASL